MIDRATVLVASDDEGTRAQVRMTLGVDRFEVHEAQDTDEAIREIAERLPVVVILDLALPGRGALAVARSVRTQPETAMAKSLLLVPRGEQVAADAVGVDASLAVPTTSFALLRKVDDLLTAG